MSLSPDDVQLFFKIQRALFRYLKEKLNFVAPPSPESEDAPQMSADERCAVRNAWLEHLELTDSFADENPAGLDDEALAIVRSWRNPVVGSFYILRDLSKYSVFFPTTGNPIPYGVVALSGTFKDLVGPHRPVLVQNVVLLPFKDRIVCDGFMAFAAIKGPGIQDSLNQYRESKAKYGIVTSLPMNPRPAKAVARRKTTASLPIAASRDQIAGRLEAITSLIDGFCRENLNEEYAEMSRELAKALARKRPTPLLKSSPEAWASGIVRAIGLVNFLSDPDQTPYMKLSDICKGFGVSDSTSQARASEIRKLLKIQQMDPRWTLPSMLEQNPLVWMFETIEGLIIDIRDAPRELQEAAFNEGLIPYIPADRPSDDI